MAQKTELSRWLVAVIEHQFPELTKVQVDLGHFHDQIILTHTDIMALWQAARNLNSTFGAGVGIRTHPTGFVIFAA